MNYYLHAVLSLHSHLRSLFVMQTIAPPSPLAMTHEMPDQNHIGMHTLGRNITR